MQALVPSKYYSATVPTKYYSAVINILENISDNNFCLSTAWVSLGVVGTNMLHYFYPRIFNLFLGQIYFKRKKNYSVKKMYQIWRMSVFMLILIKNLITVNCHKNFLLNLMHFHNKNSRLFFLLKGGFRKRQFLHIVLQA